jgi:hypothetical protein
VGHIRDLAGGTDADAAAAEVHEVAWTLAARESAEIVIAGPSSQGVGFRPNFDESGDVFLSKECDFGYDCVFARDKMGFISKPDHIGAQCFESGWDHFACTTLACSAHAHHSQKLNLKYVFVMMIPHHSRPH